MTHQERLNDHARRIRAVIGGVQKRQAKREQTDLVARIDRLNRMASNRGWSSNAH